MRKKKKTSDRRKLTEATVVTTETVIDLHDKRERVDTAKALQKQKKLTKAVNTPPSSISAPRNTKASQKGAQQAHKPTVQFMASGSEDSEWDEASDSDGSEYSGATSGQQGSQKLDNQVGTTAGSSGVSGDGPEEGTSHDSHVYSTAEGSGRALRPRK